MKTQVCVRVVRVAGSLAHNHNCRYTPPTPAPTSTRPLAPPSHLGAVITRAALALAGAAGARPLAARCGVLLLGAAAAAGGDAGGLDWFKAVNADGIALLLGWGSGEGSSSEDHGRSGIREGRGGGTEGHLIILLHLWEGWRQQGVVRSRV